MAIKFVGKDQPKAAPTVTKAPAEKATHEPAAATMQTEIVLDSGQAIDNLFQATVEATEEAIINALFQATTMVGRDGHVREALPIPRVMEIMRAAGRVG